MYSSSNIIAIITALYLGIVVVVVNAQSTEILLGSIVTREHDAAGDVYLLSERVLEVRNFVYDGEAPAVYFWGDTNPVPSAGGFRLYDGSPNNGCGINPLPVEEFGTNTYRVEFPDGITIYDILGGSISLWCEAFVVSFGEVVIPTTLTGVPTTVNGPPLECSANVEVPAPVPAPSTTEVVEEPVATAPTAPAPVSACLMEIYAYTELNTCTNSNANAASARAFLIADGQCRSVLSSASVSPATDLSSYNLLPGNYRAECINSTAVRILESGCITDQCDSTSLVTGATCDRNNDIAASLYSRVDVPEYLTYTNFDTSYTCTEANGSNTTVSFVIFGDCSLPTCALPTPAPIVPMVTPTQAPITAPTQPAPITAPTTTTTTPEIPIPTTSPTLVSTGTTTTAPATVTTAVPIVVVSNDKGDDSAGAVSIGIFLGIGAVGGVVLSGLLGFFLVYRKRPSIGKAATESRREDPNMKTTTSETIGSNNGNDNGTSSQLLSPPIVPQAPHNNNLYDVDHDNEQDREHTLNDVDVISNHQRRHPTADATVPVSVVASAVSVQKSSTLLQQRTSSYPVNPALHVKDQCRDYVPVSQPIKSAQQPVEIVSGIEFVSSIQDNTTSTGNTTNIPFAVAIVPSSEMNHHNETQPPPGRRTMLEP